MKQLKFISTIILFFLTVSSWSQNTSDSSLIKACSEIGFTKFLPKSSQKSQLVKHKAYTLAYSELHEQALWVSYVLSANECTLEEERSSTFFKDSKVKTGSATNEDYKSSGYDRGHLAPAGDMGYSPITMKESFYYSNMSPQVPAFNRGIWKKLETEVRDWAKSYGSCLVITGPILIDTVKYKTIGPNAVSVPNAYYKIVINPNLNSPEAIAFVLKNEASSAELTKFVVTIDELERMSGIDFLPNVSKQQQETLENHVNGTFWKGMETVMILAK
ncbi:MAG: DNA/RNA non-specific endonuclease [Fluviicola sp.]|nr:DNA/RNA non-specific endonuclease [Fluviicola sp.]